ncbi:hypothetical protein VZT92_011067 [Zoarces viviparus]|uniref:Uncharacterized protein n=1 Tax=Zoarces viviparus TaxID=48416 RepID=A0AAW1FB99_ZOAVI
MRMRKLPWSGILRTQTDSKHRGSPLNQISFSPEEEEEEEEEDTDTYNSEMKLKSIFNGFMTSRFFVIYQHSGFIAMLALERLHLAT